MAYKGYGIFDDNATKRKNHRFRNLSEVLQSASDYKSEQEPGEVAQKLINCSLKAMEDGNKRIIKENFLKMANEISDEQMKDFLAGKKGAKHPPIKDEFVSIEITKEIDFKKTCQNIRMGDVEYNKKADTVISKEGYRELQAAIEEAHKKGERSITIRVPMSYKGYHNAYKYNKETGEFFPKRATEKDLKAIANKDGFSKVEGKPGLWKKDDKEKYIRVDPHNPSNSYETDKNGKMLYETEYVKQPPMYEFNSSGTGFKMEADKETGELKPELKKYTINVDFAYTAGLKLIKDGKTLTEGSVWDENGKEVKDENGNPIRTGKILGNAPKDSQDWKDFSNFMARMEHVGPKYARNQTMEAMREAGQRMGHFAANEAFRTSVNMAIRAPIQAGHEGDRQISQLIATFIMPAVRSQSR